MKPSSQISSPATAAAADSLAAMIEKELTVYTCRAYLDPHEPTIITPDDRRAMVDWCYGVVDNCQYSRDVVAVAMEMVDRFLSVPSNFADQALHDQNRFQLLAITALYVAIKVNERVPMSSELFAEISLGLYTVEEIEEMERRLLSGISWRCNAPTAAQVGLSILSLILPFTKCSDVTRDFLMDEMKYLSELAVRDYFFSTQRASTVALATIFNALGRIRGRERQDLLHAFLCIVGCFDFAEPKLIEAASKKLQGHLQQEESPAASTEMVDVYEEVSNDTKISSMNRRVRQGLKHYLREVELQRDANRSPRTVSQNSCGCRAA